MYSGGRGAEGEQWRKVTRGYFIQQRPDLLSVLNWAESMDDEEAADLDKTSNQVDTSVFNFDKFKEPIITSMPINFDYKMLHAFGGMTYPCGRTSSPRWATSSSR